MRSLTFDHAVSFYDKTRALPGWVSRAVTDSIVNLARLNPASQVLEIGIGTGRIALPLLRRGFPIIGIDLAMPMMEELQTKIGGNDSRVMLAQADANEVPFADATFDCVYAVHVYHLVANWQNALAQAWRVVKPGGCFLVTFHRRDPQAPNRKLRRRLFELAKEQGVDHSSRRNDRAGKEWMMPTRHFGFGDPPTTKGGTGLPRTGEYEIRLTSDARKWNCRYDEGAAGETC